jgi:hypothetical protein
MLGWFCPSILCIQVPILLQYSVFWNILIQTAFNFKIASINGMGTRIHRQKAFLCNQSWVPLSLQLNSLFNGFCRLCFHLRAALLQMFHCLTFSFTLYTTCFGLHGHLQVCRMFYFRIPEGICFAGFSCMVLHFARFHLCFPVLFSSLINLLASRQTHTQETAKLTRKQNRNIQMETCKVQPHASKTSEADSFRNTKIKHPTHLKMAM